MTYEEAIRTIPPGRYRHFTEDYNIPSQHLCERLGMRREGLFMEFVSFINNPDGTPHYENTVQYAILKKEWNSNHPGFVRMQR